MAVLLLQNTADFQDPGMAMLVYLSIT